MEDKVANIYLAKGLVPNVYVDSSAGVELNQTRKNLNPNKHLV